MKTLVDSSVWVALFLDFDTQHTKAVQLFKKLRGELVVPYCVVSEVASVLAYKHSKKQADGFLAYLEGNKDVCVLADDPLPEIAHYLSLSARVSFADAALVFLAQEKGFKLVTFDKQLERLAAKSK